MSSVAMSDRDAILELSGGWWESGVIANGDGFGSKWECKAVLKKRQMNPIVKESISANVSGASGSDGE